MLDDPEVVEARITASVDMARVPCRGGDSRPAPSHSVRFVRAGQSVPASILEGGGRRTAMRATGSSNCGEAERLDRGPRAGENHRVAGQVRKGEADHG